ncbi:reverse transcriptase domain-containing protein [Tanacetum coccineum]
MEEMLYKFIDEGKRKHEEMRAFIYDFQTTNKILFKERNNSLIELRFRVQELLKVINNTPMIDCEVKQVTTRGEKTTTQYTQNDDTNVRTEEPIAENHDKPIQTPPIPFPRRLRKEKEEAQHKKFLENLKQLHINLPFIEALAQMPKYAKFLKGLLTNKARLEEACTITMNERCSSVLLNKLPSKEKDPKSFTIPCNIGQLHINNALADLGASISLMPYTMYEKLGLGEPKATRMSLELADRSIQYPRGIIKNVLIKFDKFVLLIDFVILDMPKDSRVPIILRRPFLATARAMINVFNKKITLRVRDDKVIFNVDQLIKRPPTKDDECYGIDDLDDTINAKAQELLANEEPDSSRVSPIHVVPKKGGMTVVLNDDNELIPSCTVTGWRVMQRSSYLSKMYDGNFPRHGRRLYGSIHGRLLGIEVDRAKIDVIAKLPYPTNVKEFRSFLGHAGFYQRFIKDFSMISKPMIKLLMKDMKFDFSDDCKKAFNILKEKLTTAPIKISPDWDVPLELIRDASDFTVGAVLGQRIDGKFKPIYYASKNLNIAQEHYTTTEKELLVVVFSFDKFRPYLVLLLQGFDIEIKDKRGAENLAADHLSRLENPDLGMFTEEETADEFPDEHLMVLKTELNNDKPWGHHSASVTGRKVYESGFFLPTIFKDAKDYMMRCDACQRSRNISSRSEMPQNNIQIWCIREHPDLQGRTKKWHDSRLRGDKDFKVEDLVLLFNSRFKMHPESVSRLMDKGFKKYHERHIDTEDKEVVEFEDDTT